MSATTSAKTTATVQISGATITLDDLERLVRMARDRGAPGQTSVGVTEGRSYPGEFGTPAHSLRLTFEVSE